MSRIDVRPIDVRPLTGAIGAEIRGVDLSQPIDDAAVEQIRAALLDHLVVFFRDQPIDDEQHAAFALRFGPLSVSPLATRYQDTPTVTVLDQVSPKGEGADEWHSDNTFMAKPPMGSILRAVQLPPWAATRASPACTPRTTACRRRVRELVDGLTAVHDITKPMRKAIAAGPHEPRPRRDAAALAAGRAPGRRAHIPRPGARRCSSTATRRRTSWG